MSMLRVALPEAECLHAAASDREVETCAVGLVHVASTGPTPHYVVREFSEVPPEAYANRTAVAAVLKPEYCTYISNSARAKGAGVLIAHTHPGDHALEGFSNADDAGEAALANFFRRRMPNAEHFSALFTRTRVHARKLGVATPVSVSSVGRQLVKNTQTTASAEYQYDRLVRAFGLDGLRSLAALAVGIVGLGGTGSVVAQQLAHLGVRTFVLIDTDTVETTN